jgi:hypothetical protein
VLLLALPLLLQLLPALQLLLLTLLQWRLPVIRVPLLLLLQLLLVQALLRLLPLLLPWQAQQLHWVVLQTSQQSPDAAAALLLQHALRQICWVRFRVL